MKKDVEMKYTTAPEVYSTQKSTREVYNNYIYKNNKLPDFNKIKRGPKQVGNKYIIITKI